MVSVDGKRKLFPMKLKLEENRLKKDCKKKDVVLLFETNHQINMTFEHFASSNTSFKKHLNAKSFKMFWKYWSSCAKHYAAGSVSVARVMWTYPPNIKGWCELSFSKNSKDPSSSTVSAETSFDDDISKEALNVNKVFPAIMGKKMDIDYIQTLPAQVPNIACRNITWNPNSRILIMLFFSFPISPYPIQPYATSIGYTEAYAKTIQSNLLLCCIQIIKPYVGETHNHQKAESLRAPSLLDNMVNSSLIFNTKCAAFSAKW